MSNPDIGGSELANIWRHLSNKVDVLRHHSGAKELLATVLTADELGLPGWHIFVQNVRTTGAGLSDDEQKRARQDMCLTARRVFRHDHLDGSILLYVSEYVDEQDARQAAIKARSTLTKRVFSPFEHKEFETVRLKSVFMLNELNGYRNSFVKRDTLEWGEERFLACSIYEYKLVCAIAYIGQEVEWTKVIDVLKRQAEKLRDHRTFD